MLRLIGILLVLAVAVAAMGYWRGWFSMTNEGSVEVQVDREKVQEDKEAFRKAVSEQTQALKDQLAGLWEETEALSGDEKTQAQTELAVLKEKQDRLEQQILELEQASQDSFEGIKQDLTKTLEEVEEKIVELKEKVNRGKDQ